MSDGGPVRVALVLTQLRDGGTRDPAGFVAASSMCFTPLRNLPEGAQERFDAAFRDIAAGALALG